MFAELADLAIGDLRRRRDELLAERNEGRDLGVCRGALAGEFDVAVAEPELPGCARVRVFGYNVAAIPLAAAGLLNPVMAGGAMTFSSVSVVANALRLRRFRALRSAAPTADRQTAATLPTTTGARA